MKLLIINVTLNTGSTGRISEEIGLLAEEHGYEVKVAYGQKAIKSKLDNFRIGNTFDFIMHVIKSRLFDLHGFGSYFATKKLISRIDNWQPDIIHLHNIHGYYINVELLFEFLKRCNKTVVWTMHDCWAFTGHCAHFERVSCYKWQTECYNCPNNKGYPTSILFDNSRNNYFLKKKLINDVKDLYIVTPSEWLANSIKLSFLSNYPTVTINNGIDLNIFKPMIDFAKLKEKYGLNNKLIVLGVANTWKKRRALKDFIYLSELLSEDFRVVLVGMNKSEAKNLSSKIIAIPRTENQQQLAELYSLSSVFVNPTYVDTFPTTNIESLACGTPIITYLTGGSAEILDSDTGYIVEKGDIKAIHDSIIRIVSQGKDYYKYKCRNRAVNFYDKKIKFLEYMDLFAKLSNLRNGILY